VCVCVCVCWREVSVGGRESEPSGESVCVENVFQRERLRRWKGSGSDRKVSATPCKQVEHSVRRRTQ
jgi:hypothetical protein